MQQFVRPLQRASYRARVLQEEGRRFELIEAQQEGQAKRVVKAQKRRWTLIVPQEQERAQLRVFKRRCRIEAVCNSLRCNVEKERVHRLCDGSMIGYGPQMLPIVECVIV